MMNLYANLNIGTTMKKIAKNLRKAASSLNIFVRFILARYFSGKLESAPTGNILINERSWTIAKIVKV